MKSELLLLLSDNILEGGGGGERGVLRLLYTVALRRPKCHSANISRQDKAETSAHIRADPNTNTNHVKSSGKANSIAAADDKSEQWCRKYHCRQ